MVIYIVLVIYILILPFIVSRFVGRDKEKTQRYTTLFGILAIFLILALKGTSVGVDISGYEEQYYLSRSIPWNDFDYVYFEKGFILFEKLFSKTGLPFQWFTVIIYFLECSALYLLISKFSKDASFSLLFFVCYQFFVFSTSGLRQTIAFSLCVYAFLLFYRGRILFSVAGVALIFLAFSIHSSAFIFFIVPCVMLFTKYFRIVSWVEIILGVVFTLGYRGSLWSFVNSNLRSVEQNSEIISGSFWFLVGIALFSLFTYNNYYGIGFFGKRAPSLKNYSLARDYDDTLAVRMTIISVLVHIMLSGGVMLRALMYITLMIIPFLPNMFEKYVLKQRIAIKYIFAAFLILLFYFQTLAVNQLHICPYKFFWE